MRVPCYCNEIKIKILAARQNRSENFILESDSAGIRTQDPYIKSVLLYQLSYRIEVLF
jgi:hypothetical protein